jgi:hypothetical protein
LSPIAVTGLYLSQSAALSALQFLLQYQFAVGGDTVADAQTTAASSIILYMSTSVMRLGT